MNYVNKEQNLINLTSLNTIINIFNFNINTCIKYIFNQHEKSQVSD